MNMVLDLSDAPNPEALTPAPATTETKPKAETPAEAKAEPTAPPELALVDQLWASWRSQLETGLEKSTAATELEAARKKYDAVSERYETHKAKTGELLNSFLDRLAEIRDPSIVGVVQQVQQSQSDTAEQSPPVASTETQMPYADWLEIPTAEVLDGIEGLGAKKTAALIEKFPNIKALEDARTEAGKSHLHFCKMLVKGIGEQTADRIETAMSDLLMGKKKRKTAIAEQPGEAAKVSDEDKEKAAIVAELEAEEIPDPAETADEIEQAAKDAGIDVPGDEDDEDDDETPWVDPNADDSIIYQDADEDESDEEGDTEDTDEDADEDEEDPDTQSWYEAFHLQAITDPEHQQTSWGANVKNQTKAWKQGSEAFKNGLAVIDCPYTYDEGEPELSLAQDWVLGWTSANMLEMDL